MAEARSVAGLENQAAALDEALKSLEQVSGHLIALAQSKGPETMLADAVLYLEMFGTVTIAWQWLTMALCARRGLGASPSRSDQAFYQGKLYTCRYFFAYELPKIKGLAQRLTDEDPLTLSMPAGCFAD